MLILFIVSISSAVGRYATDDILRQKHHPRLTIQGCCFTHIDVFGVESHIAAIETEFGRRIDIAAAQIVHHHICAYRGLSDGNKFLSRLLHLGRYVTITVNILLTQHNNRHIDSKHDNTEKDGHTRLPSVCAQHYPQSDEQQQGYEVGKEHHAVKIGTAKEYNAQCNRQTEIYITILFQF